MEHRGLTVRRRRICPALHGRCYTPWYMPSLASPGIPTLPTWQCTDVRVAGSAQTVTAWALAFNKTWVRAIPRPPETFLLWLIGVLMRIVSFVTVINVRDRVARHQTHGNTGLGSLCHTGP